MFEFDKEMNRLLFLLNELITSAVQQQGQFGFEGASSGPSGSQAHQYPGTQSMQMGGSSTSYLDTAGKYVEVPM